MKTRSIRPAPRAATHSASSFDPGSGRAFFADDPVKASANPDAARPGTAFDFSRISIHRPATGRVRAPSPIGAGQQAPIQLVRGTNRKKVSRTTRLQEKKQEDYELSQEIDAHNILPPAPRARRQPAGLGQSGFDRPVKLRPDMVKKYNLRYKKLPARGRHVDFSPYVMRTSGGKRIETTIQYQGTRTLDFQFADDHFGLTPATRPGTWHHVPDVTATGRGTMQMIPTDLHAAVPHYGGVEQYKKLAVTKGLKNFY